MPPQRAQSDGPYGRQSSSGPAYIPGVYQIFNKQKDYQREYQILQDKCNKLEEDLAQAKTDANIWAEQCRNNDRKIIGLQRKAASHVRTSTVDTEDRVNARLQQVDDHMQLVDDKLGIHTNLIRRANDETMQREEAMIYRSIGRDTELSNRLAVSEHWNRHLSEVVHQLLLYQARENEVPEAQ
eukprot:2206958-Amphidinium_carterae.1